MWADNLRLQEYRRESILAAPAWQQHRQCQVVCWPLHRLGPSTCLYGHVHGNWKVPQSFAVHSLQYVLPSLLVCFSFTGDVLFIPATLNSPQQRHLTASPSDTWKTRVQWWRKGRSSCVATSPVWLLPNTSLFGGTKETKLSSQLQEVGKVISLFGPQHLDTCQTRFWRKNPFYFIRVSARDRLPEWERHWLWCESDPNPSERVVHHHHRSGQKWQWNTVPVWGSVGPRSRWAAATSKNGVQSSQHHHLLWVHISRCVFSLCIFVFLTLSVTTSQQISPPSIPQSFQR